MYYSTYDSSQFGTITLGSDSEHLTGLWLDGQRFHRIPSDNGDVRKDELPVFQQVKQWLYEYFSKKNPSIAGLPLAPAGSEFRQRVWNILCEIPYGKLITYGDIAKRISAETGITRMSAQAVGGAVGHNPISVIIPCHRVVGQKGNLTGYGGGIDLKIKLLKLEEVHMTDLYVPAKGTAL